MREQTNLNGVKAVAKSLLMIDLHLTDYSPVIVQHPFTSSGMVACPSEDGLRLMDITKSDEDLKAWQEYMKGLIDNAKNPYHIYMMINKPYALAFLNLAENHLSQKDFTEILSDAWIRSENPNMDNNFVKKNLVDMFKKADKSILMDGEEMERFNSFEDPLTVYRGVTPYETECFKCGRWIPNEYLRRGSKAMAERRKKGSGSIRERSDGRWEGRVIIGYDDNGKPIQKSVFGKTKTECSKKLKQLKEDTVAVAGRLPSQAKPNMKFGEWMDMWYQYYGKIGVSVTTQNSYQNYIYKHIIVDIGHLQLDQVTQKHLQDYYEQLKISGRLVRQDVFGSGVSDRMVRGCHAMCRKALEKACKEGLIPNNPAIGCKIPPKKAREMEILTHEEVQKVIIQAAYDGYYELFLLEFATGMRRGEICGLQWNDIDFETGELKIRRQVVNVNDGIVVKKPKTKGSTRTIIVETALLNVLYELKQKTDSEWIFPSPVKQDSPLNPHTVYRKTQQILERAECKKVRFHDLRHTFATLSLENGMDIKTLSNMIGHSSVATTVNIRNRNTNTLNRQSHLILKINTASFAKCGTRGIFIFLLKIQNLCKTGIICSKSLVNQRKI